jgi:hypothetical protein
MKIQHVPLDFVNQVWPRVVHYLDAAIVQQDGEPDFTLDQVRTYVTNGQWMMIVAIDAESKIHGAATINFFNRPNDRVAFITYIGGRLVANKDTFDQLCTLCKTFGATKIEGAVNEAVSRLWRKFGFKEKYRIAEVALP